MDALGFAKSGASCIEVALDLYLFAGRLAINAFGKYTPGQFLRYHHLGSEFSLRRLYKTPWCRSSGQKPSPSAFAGNLQQKRSSRMQSVFSFSECSGLVQRVFYKLSRGRDDFLGGRHGRPQRRQVRRWILFFLSKAAFQATITRSRSVLRPGALRDKAANPEQQRESSRLRLS